MYKLHEETSANDEKIIESAIKLFGGVYVGKWCLKNSNGIWSNFPIHIFYQENPDTSKGHSNYYGIFFDGIKNSWVICNGASAFESPIYGIVDDGLVYVSRFRHDYVLTPNGHSIDGGRDYTKYHISEAYKESGKLVLVTINKNQFEFKEISALE